jgi:hypothetical protein
MFSALLCFLYSTLLVFHHVVDKTKTRFLVVYEIVICIVLIYSLSRANVKLYDLSRPVEQKNTVLESQERSFYIL